MPELDKKAVWPEWETVRLIGRGSFGTVYEIERDVYGHKEQAALKVIRIPQHDSDIEELYDSGYDEAEVTATYRSHLESIVNEYSMMREMNGAPNIVKCDDFRVVPHDDNIGYDIFIKMELLTSLTKALVKQPSEEQVIRIAKDMCTALILCRQYEIIHRDIKPQNIFVSKNGDYKLGDFGIAKTMEKTTGGTMIGTYKYMAPEIYNNKPYKFTADIYSLGLVLHWLLNEHRSPFMPLPPEPVGASMEEKARLKRFKGVPIPVPVHGSEELKRIVLKACSYDPKDRYQSAGEMLQDLRILSGESSPEAVIPAVEKKKKLKAESVEIKELDADKTLSSFNRGSANGKQAEKKPPKKNKWIIPAAAVALIAIIVAFSTGLFTKDKTTTVERQTDSPVPLFTRTSETLRQLNKASVGDTITFGHYEQDNDLTNGQEEIEWIVLDKADGKLLLISRYALESQPYSKGYSSISWEDCSLRRWLNESFFKEAFSEEEQALIPGIPIENQGYDLNSGNNGIDKIFLISISEGNKYFTSDEGRKCVPTEYAVAQGAYRSGQYSVDEKPTCYWWLRSRGANSSYAAVVLVDGSVSDSGSNVILSRYGVRPAFWIDPGS